MIKFIMYLFLFQGIGRAPVLASSRYRPSECPAWQRGHAEQETMGREAHWLWKSKKSHNIWGRRQSRQVEKQAFSSLCIYKGPTIYFFIFFFIIVHCFILIFVWHLCIFIIGYVSRFMFGEYVCSSSFILRPRDLLLLLPCYMFSFVFIL